MGLPKPLRTPVSALARAVLTSPLFDATIARTDTYNALLCDPATFRPGGHALMAHSEADGLVPVAEFRASTSELRRRWGGEKGLVVYEGKGRHAALGWDDPTFARTVNAWLADTRLFDAHELL